MWISIYSTENLKEGEYYLVEKGKVDQLQAELDKHKQPCKWQYDKWYETWRTECDNAQEFLEGGIKDNRYKFCPYCGRKIVVVKGEKDGH